MSPRPKPPSCSGCDAVAYGVGFVPPTTATHRTRFAVVGQGPGEQEAEFSIPFYPLAPTGRMLRGWLHEAGIDERDVAVGNIVQCWLPKVKMSGNLGRESRPPTPAEVSHCYRAHVHPWLHSLPEDTHFISVGADATRFLLGLTGSVDHLLGVTHRLPLPEPDPYPTPEETAA